MGLSLWQRIKFAWKFRHGKKVGPPDDPQISGQRTRSGYDRRDPSFTDPKYWLGKRKVKGPRIKQRRRTEGGTRQN